MNLSPAEEVWKRGTLGGHVGALAKGGLGPRVSMCPLGWATLWLCPDDIRVEEVEPWQRRKMAQMGRPGGCVFPRSREAASHPQWLHLQASVWATPCRKPPSPHHLPPICHCLLRLRWPSPLPVYSCLCGSSLFLMLIAWTGNL